MPAYLQRRKAEWSENARVEAERAAAAAECPPGLRLVPEGERSRIMQTLLEQKAKATADLHALPFVIKTHASQQRKDKLEDRLQEIDGAIEAYSKEKVFVPAGS